MIRAVLDANVFISAAINIHGSPAGVLRAAGAGSFTVVLTPALIAEVFEAFDYPRVRKTLQKKAWLEDSVELVARTFAISNILDAPALPELVVAGDPDDDECLAAAIAGRASFVVTGDRLLLDVDEYEGVRIVTPAEFLAELVQVLN